jgi:DNA-binding SARP family transcriptional activator
MSRLSVRLFGKLSVRCNDCTLESLTASKVQELFCYLLLRRNRPLSRESVAALLWGDIATAQSKKYLRQALWLLQVSLRCHVEPAEKRILLADSEWVQLNAGAGLWLDVDVFEQAYAAAQGVPSDRMDAPTVSALEKAVQLYQGELLEGWYHDWCLRERERLQAVYLAILDRLMGHCEARGSYEAGQHYGALSLRCDRARECTHQRLMRLHSLAGDRAGALRQYDRCVIALDEELGVKPSDATVALYDSLRGGQHSVRVIPFGERRPLAEGAPFLSDVLGQLSKIQDTLAALQRQVRAEIQTVENALCPAAGNARRPAHRVPVEPVRVRRPRSAAQA